MKITNKLLSKYYLLLVFLATVITAGIDLYSYDNVNYGTLYIQRQFGNEIKFNILFVVILIGTFFSFATKKIKRDCNPISALVFLSIFSLLFPNNKDIHLAIIGVTVMIKYFLLYFSLTHIYNFNEFKKNLKKTLIIVLIIESIGGFLQIFFGVTIPFLTSRNVKSYRGSTLRMAGTMLFSADLALIITFITVFLWCDYFFNKNRRVLKYIILCMIDLWLCGSRTMVIATGLIFTYSFMRKYRNKTIYKILFITFLFILLLTFLNTNVFFEYFVSDNIVLMLFTRLVHWRMGYEMILQHPLLGVGLNNSMFYINQHSDIVHKAYTVALEPKSFFFTNPIHNSIIIILAELGIVGGISYLLIFIEPIIKCMKDKINCDKSDVCFVVSAGMMLIIYALQGWGSLKEHGMVLMMVYYAYFRLLQNNKIKQKSITYELK